MSEFAASAPRVHTPEPSIPYKNLMFMTVMMLWLGPTSMLFVMLAATVLYGPVATLPLWRRLIKDTYCEYHQLYVLLTQDPVATTPNPQLSSSSSMLRSIGKKIKHQFYDTL